MHISYLIVGNCALPPLEKSININYLEIFSRGDCYILLLIYSTNYISMNMRIFILYTGFKPIVVYFLDQIVSVLVIGRTLSFL